MFPMHPPEYFQVRDVEGTLHLINRWMIARIEVRGTEGNLTTARPTTRDLNEEGSTREGFGSRSSARQRGSCSSMATTP
jgi:hypothetical protein